MPFATIGDDQTLPPVLKIQRVVLEVGPVLIEYPVWARSLWNIVHDSFVWELARAAKANIKSDDKQTSAKVIKLQNFFILSTLYSEHKFDVMYKYFRQIILTKRSQTSLTKILGAISEF